MTEPNTTAERRGTSLLADIRSGAAGAGVRAVVSAALGFLLCGLALVMSCVLAAMSSAFGHWSWARHRDILLVEDEALLVSFLIAGAAYLAALYWIWSRLLHRRGLWLAGAATVGVWVVAVALCIGSAAVIGDDEGIAMSVVMWFAVAATLVVWVQAWRRYGRGRSAFDSAGQFDVRCVSCGYSMIGLYDTRCPECGEMLTLEQLLLRQSFDKTQRQGGGEGEAPPSGRATGGTVPEPSEPAHRRATSLLQQWRGGDAGPVTRVFVSLALGLLLCGPAVGIPYLLIAIPRVVGLSADMRWGRGGSVEQALLLVSFLIAALVYSVLLRWVWSRPMHQRESWLAGAHTVGICAITITLCVGCGAFMPFARVELTIFAVISIASARTLLVWTQVRRRYDRGQAGLDAVGEFDMRCPSCACNMVGLYDTRCPECTEALTLDQLLRRQGFEETPRCS